MLHRALGGARDLARRSRRAILRFLAEEQASPQAAPPPAPPPAPSPEPPLAEVSPDAVSELSARLEHLAAGFELWRQRFEADQLSWQRLFTEEARVRDARLWDQLARASARSPFDLLDPRSLRPPRVPSDFTPRPSAEPKPAVDAGRSPPPGPAVRGLIEQVSLSSLLGLFELERRDGVFSLSATEGSVELHLRRGAIVLARCNGQASDVVTALGRAFEFATAEFQFTSVPVTADSDAPTSLNGLLLEVLYRHDEARRTG